ncbi:MAG TPA: 16S rRNA (guanine(527)-N(7))-methyltransferase RsmG, partial [Rectinemataceae bacterium]|nr:16S rRNA (guanine(527)-N(7))-methyltransferase RsmG [Rectinemataceae bacterium]
MNDVPPLLIRGLAALGIEREPRTVDTLQRYLDELERWNPAYGLVNATGDELVVKHILDSLA